MHVSKEKAHCLHFFKILFIAEIKRDVVDFLGFYVG